MSESPSTAPATPFDRIGGEAVVRALVERFYDAMDAQEPELAALHPLEDGKVSRASRERFALFLIGWLGGPQDYMRLHGHPRLRMRHGHVPVSAKMRDAWMRSMRVALADPSIGPELRDFLDQKLDDLATFLRNQPG
ncbi:MAG: Hemoglobin-like protein HbO [Polyangiaceae bacterium]|jgi:hemoglobin|nr:Hemoglobin-like protein HbO [Polyangiaceae bacterium]